MNDHDTKIPMTGAPYGDTPEERARELIETGSSIRHHGKPIFTALREALFPDGDEPEGAAR